MTWSTSREVGGFLAAAGEFLRSRPVEHTVLLTEAAYLEAWPRPAADDQFGWWRNAAGRVAGAFLRAPRHAPVLSPMPAEAVESLAEVLAGAQALDVPAGLVETVAAVWQRRFQVEPVERSRITLYRLQGPVPPVQPPGKARIASGSDRELLLTWYHKMMARFPEDPSEPEYVIDDPLTFGGIVLWEVDGVPVAMAGRSRRVAGMVRLGAVYAVDEGSHADAAFSAVCRSASELAEHVLVFAPAGNSESARKYAALGFRPALDRVMVAAP